MKLRKVFTVMLVALMGLLYSPPPTFAVTQQEKVELKEKLNLQAVCADHILTGVTIVENQMLVTTPTEILPVSGTGQTEIKTSVTILKYGIVKERDRYELIRRQRDKLYDCGWRPQVLRYYCS